MNKTVSARKIVATVFVFLGLFFSLIAPVFSQNDPNPGDTFGLQPVQNTIKLSAEDPRVIAGKIIVVILGLLGIITFGLILYAGFLIMTSAGNEEKVAKGKRVMINALIGFIIIVSAFAIVQFVMKSLTDAFGDSGGGGDSDGSSAPFFASFSGTGGLGSIIKDHYPRPNQTDIPRNTKIAVTFAAAISPGTVIKNTNNTCWPKDGSGKPVPIQADVCELFTEGQNKDQPVPYYGDCTDLNNDKLTSWETECDRVDTGSVQVFLKSQATSTNKALVEMAALTSYDQERKAYSFSFRPLQPIGSNTENIWYTVKLVGGASKTVGIKKLDGSDIFPAQFISHFYSWNFQTNTTIDITPPHVSFTRPAANQNILRNTIVQINFSEAMDPSAAQGILKDSSFFSTLIFNDPKINGEWKISNGYSTLEFLSSEQCGQNSCGEPMYCLPAIGCDPKDTTCVVPYEILARTAELANKNDNSFHAQPFTGLADMAGNALDNGSGNKADGKLAVPHKPNLPGNFKTIGVDEKNPDNYWWSFKVQNELDRSIPYIKSVSPALDGEGVKGTDLIQIFFSKKMWYSTIPYGAGVVEYPANVKGGKDNVPLENFAYYFEMKDKKETDSTVATILHPREFGPGGLDLYYFTFVSSSVKAENQNCLYPGRGPAGEKNTVPECDYQENPDGTIKSNKNCVGVKYNADTDTGCVFGVDESDNVQPDVIKCLDTLKKMSPTSPI